MQVYLFVFSRPPESLDKHIVSSRALPSMLFLMPLSFVRLATTKEGGVRQR